MEARSGAHHWARKFARVGHTVRLMAPKFVVPHGLWGKRGKNDAADAAAVLLPELGRKRHRGSSIRQTRGLPPSHLPGTPAMDVPERPRRGITIHHVGAGGIVHMPRFNGKQEGTPHTADLTCAAPATVSR
jgi:hypothetical protein